MTSKVSFKKFCEEYIGFIYHIAVQQSKRYNNLMERDELISEGYLILHALYAEIDFKNLGHKKYVLTRIENGVKNILRRLVWAPQKNMDKIDVIDNNMYSGYAYSRDPNQDIIDKKAMKERLNAFLRKKLAPEIYKIYVYIYRDDLSQRDVGAKYGITQQSVSLRLIKIKKAIKIFLESEGVGNVSY